MHSQLLLQSSESGWFVQEPRTRQRGASAFGGSTKRPHGCAATVWRFYGNMDQNSWEGFPGKVEPVPQSITSAGNAKKKVRKGEKTRCCWGSGAPGVSSWRPAAVCDVMWTHCWCPRFLQRVSDAGPACAAALDLSRWGSMRRRRPEWQWPSPLTSTTRGVVRLPILCGTRAVRLGLREAAWSGREVIFSAGHECYCCMCTPPPRGTRQCCIGTPASVQRGAAMQRVKIEPTGDIFSCNNSGAVLKMIFRKSCKSLQVWIWITSGFSKNLFYSNVLLIQRRKNINEYLCHYKTHAKSVRIQCCDVVNNLKMITYITMSKELLLVGVNWCHRLDICTICKLKWMLKKGIKQHKSDMAQVLQLCALKKGSKNRTSCKCNF